MTTPKGSDVLTIKSCSLSKASVRVRLSHCVSHKKIVIIKAVADVEFRGRDSNDWACMYILR
jgi:hypothetical protein